MYVYACCVLCVFHCGARPFYHCLLHIAQARTREQKCWRGGEGCSMCLHMYGILKHAPCTKFHALEAILWENNQWRRLMRGRRKGETFTRIFVISEAYGLLLSNIHTLQKFNIRNYSYLFLTFACIQSMGMRKMSEQIKINSLSMLLYLYESSMVHTSVIKQPSIIQR